MSDFFERDSTLLSDQEEIQFVSKGNVTNDVENALRSKALAIVNTNDLMELGALGLTIEEYEMLSGRYFSAYLVPNVQTDEGSNLYRVAVTDSNNVGLEAMCPIGHIARTFPAKDLRVSSQRDVVKTLSRAKYTKPQYLGDMQFARTLEGMWLELSENGQLDLLEEEMTKEFGIPYVPDRSYEDMMYSLEEGSLNSYDVPARGYWTAKTYVDVLVAKLDRSELTPHEVREVLGKLIERYAIPDAIVGGIFAKHSSREDLEETFDSVIMQRCGDYSLVRSILRNSSSR